LGGAGVAPGGGAWPAWASCMSARAGIANETAPKIIALIIAAAMMPPVRLVKWIMIFLCGSWLCQKLGIIAGAKTAAVWVVDWTVGYRRPNPHSFRSIPAILYGSFMASDGKAARVLATLLRCAV
jgi:hypothetical protein